MTPNATVIHWKAFWSSVQQELRAHMDGNVEAAPGPESSLVQELNQQFHAVSSRLEAVEVRYSDACEGRLAALEEQLQSIHQEVLGA